MQTILDRVHAPIQRAPLPCHVFLRSKVSGLIQPLGRGRGRGHGHGRGYGYALRLWLFSRASPAGSKSRVERFPLDSKSRSMLAVNAYADLRRCLSVF